MLYSLFYTSTIKNENFNRYLCDLLDIIIDISKDDNDSLESIFIDYAAGGFHDVELYIDIPKGYEGDRYYTFISNSVAGNIFKLLRDHASTLYLLIEYKRSGQYYTFKSHVSGVLILHE